MDVIQKLHKLAQNQTFVKEIGLDWYDSTYNIASQLTEMYSPEDIDQLYEKMFGDVE